ncbi:glycopeptide antibiotics resistance protein [Microbacterium testaceum]|uniref:VanZ family protein n=1 Tax=Microbacterium TaxID=33882 RepID=UPI002781F594|nr:MULTISPECIES: VanZ family protein [Microbacterium]MDQ1111681.1 glycopeptide antibiotics resistance protein [Microbacterium testaceum]MDR6097781.1 glycopeptide antibiotics resistance protein [Microbacterium sp. SORGH_AS_0454]
MDNIVGSGVLAVVAGAVVAILAFVPFVAVSYRRRGRLTVWRSLLWAGAAVYFWAIWTYTLIPLPDSEVYRCAGVNLHPFAFVDEVRAAVAASGRYLTDPVVLQVALNVLLFAPLGFFLRVLGGRGILIAGLVGFATSGIIETTQLTGVWGLFPCAYRVFDVDDLISNTSGALIGSVLAFVVPAQHRGVERAADADTPRPVTRRRRLLGLVCDVVGVWLVGFAVAVVVQAVLVLLVGERSSFSTDQVASLAGTIASAGLWLGVILATGRSIGDLATRVRFTNGVLPAWVARPLRFATGAGAYAVLAGLPAPWSLLAFLLASTTAALLLVWPDGRGLTGWIGRRRLVDDRAGVVSPSVDRGARV